MPSALLRGIDINYEHGGTGPRLLWINGSGASLETTGPMLDPYRERFELLAHDQRALGATTVPDEPPTMADYALDALALADHVGWDTFAVMGTSFGGMVAQELAVTAPERVKRLALCCTSPGGEGGASYPLHELGPGDASPTILDTRFTPEWLAEHELDAAIAELFSGARDGGLDARGPKMQLEARRGHDVWERLPRITCPTLVAAGRFDGIAPLANSEAIVSRIPQAELRVYDGGHIFFIQDPTAVPDVIEFLAAA